MPQDVYKARRWPVFVIAGAAVALAIVLPAIMAQTPEPVQKILVPAYESESSNKTSSPSKTSPIMPEETSAKKSPRIPDSQAIAIRVPSAKIDAKVYSLEGCQKVIEPPLNGSLVGAVFGCVDFDQPGSRTKDVSVLAGHSSLKIDTVFNRLYVKGDALRNHEVWIKTKASANRWLVYKIYDVLTPLKEDLPYMTKVWGAPGEKEPGKLVLVTCLWDESGESPSNFITLAQFERVARR